MKNLTNLIKQNETFAKAASENQKLEIDLSGFEPGKKGQAPKVAILACADSRVAPELIFQKE